VAGHSPLGLDA
jgi:transposase